MSEIALNNGLKFVERYWFPSHGVLRFGAMRLDRLRIIRDGVTSSEGPVELIDGKLTLRIPLKAGGAKMIPSARGISYIDGEFLNMIIPDWLAEKLPDPRRSVVVVNNRGAKFNLWLSDPESGGKLKLMS